MMKLLSVSKEEQLSSVRLFSFPESEDLRGLIRMTVCPGFKIGMFGR